MAATHTRTLASQLREMKSREPSRSEKPAKDLANILTFSWRLRKENIH